MQNTKTKKSKVIYFLLLIYINIEKKNFNDYFKPKQINQVHYYGQKATDKIIGKKSHKGLQNRIYNNL